MLFGLIPAAMAWRERYDAEMLSLVRVMPGGRVVLIGVGGIAAAVIVNEIVETVVGLVEHGI